MPGAGDMGNARLSTQCFHELTRSTKTPGMETHKHTMKKMPSSVGNWAIYPHQPKPLFTSHKKQFDNCLSLRTPGANPETMSGLLV